MERIPYTTLSLLTGPLLGLCLAAFAFVVHMGPGLFFFCLAAGALLTVISPLFQLFLIRYQGMSSRPWQAAALSVGSIALLAVVSTFTGIFDFW